MPGAGTPTGTAPELWHHGGLEPGRLHEQRLAAVTAILAAAGSRRVLDVGCGSGLLIERLLALPAIEQVTGIDASALALGQARERLGDGDGRLRLHLAPFDQPVLAPGTVDAVTLVEVIEHIDPARLSRLEHGLLRHLGAPLVVITTPNAEYNPLLGLAPGRLRHPEHRFEWSRARFRAWARGVADRLGYALAVSGIGDADPLHGPPTQMAVFRHLDA
jgi:2-polyprenyl-3-methyl-5-hydroxy-6-metoxy-1,4-benzoquinol methylase